MFRLLGRSKFLVVLPLLLTLWAAFAGPSTSLAKPIRQEPTPENNTYSFDDLGFGEQILVGPAEVKRLQFNLPASWAIANDAAITLDLTAAVTQIGDAVAGDPAIVNAVVTVALNNVRLNTLQVTNEVSRSVTLPLTEKAILAGGDDGRQELTITLQTGSECSPNQQFSLTVGASSFFELPHETIALPLDLALLPRPLYQRSFLPESATLIIPDKPSATEIQSALTVAAGLGRMTGNRLAISLQQSSALTETQYAASHLIFIGKPAGLPELEEINLPATASSTGFTSEGFQTDDGIIQIAPSPWNKEMVALVISGNTDIGVLKASQAFASRQTLVSPKATDISIIAEVNPDVNQEKPPVDQAFTDLGYEARRIAQPGTGIIVYEFFIPEGFELDSEAFIDLSFTHSALVDYEQSGLVASLNDAEIGSVRFSDATTSLSDARFIIPRSAIRAGRNTLSLRASLIPTSECFNSDTLDIWMSIWPDSIIHLPLTPAAEGLTRSLSLNEYPLPFVNSPSLNTTAFVLSTDDLSGWQAAIAIAADMGARINGLFVNLAAAYSDDVPDELRQQRDLIVVGRPSSSALITELNEALPAPYAEGSDQAISRVSQVTFRTEGASVGNLQLLSAPWNKQRIVLAVLGSSDESLIWAGQALTAPDLRARLGGTFALVVDQQIFLGGTRLANLQPVTAPATAPATEPISGTTALTVTETISTTEQPAGSYSNATPPSSGPSPLLPLGISIAVMIAIVGGVIGLMWLRNRPRRSSALSAEDTSSDQP